MGFFGGRVGGDSSAGFVCGWGVVWVGPFESRLAKMIRAASARLTLPPMSIVFDLGGLAGREGIMSDLDAVRDFHEQAVAFRTCCTTVLPRILIRGNLPRHAGEVQNVRQKKVLPACLGRGVEHKMIFLSVDA